MIKHIAIITNDNSPRAEIRSLSKAVDAAAKSGGAGKK